MIGHALARVARPHDDVTWDRLIAVGFALGSACFLIGPFPGFVQLVGAEADAAVFFAGSILFTLAAALELREGTVRRGRRWGTDPSWWSAFAQFVGTLLFNVSTYDALQEDLTAHQEDRLIWTPDLVGSICFLVSGAIAYRVCTGPGWRPARRDRAWVMAAVNLLGCILFGVSAVGAYIVPDTGSILDLAAANWGTSLGALCFLIGAVLLYPRGHR